MFKVWHLSSLIVSRAGGSCVPQQRSRRLYGRLLWLPAGRGGARTHRSATYPKGETLNIPPWMTVTFSSLHVLIFDTITSFVHSLYGQKYWDTPFFRREKGKLATKMETQFTYLKMLFSPLLQQFLSVWNDGTHRYKSLVFGDKFLAQGLHLKSHQRCSAAFCRPVKFFHTDWIIISLWSLSYTQRHCHARIEKGHVQTVAIQLEAHNEYHYMLKL